MVQYIEHETLVDELVTLETFSPEERLSHARKRRQEQLKSYDVRDKRPDLFPNYHASHNKNIRFEKNIELIEAASRNDAEEVEQLLSQGVSPDLQNEDGLSALHQAVIEDCQDVVETLINKGADLNIKDADLWTPLHAAVACGNYDLVKYLIDRGASLVEINTDGNMPIDLVEDMEDVEVLLDESMANAGYSEEDLEEIRNATANLMLEDLREAFHAEYDLNTQGSHGETTMHIAAANGYDEVVEYLLDHGAKINVVDFDEWQPIHAAACWGHDKIIEILVNHGADLDAVTKDGETPYDLTEDEELQGMIIELKESGTKTRELKRSQSNSSRTLSVRRTSIVEKHKTSISDAKNEAILRQNPDFINVVINTGDEIVEEEENRKISIDSIEPVVVRSSPDEKQEIVKTETSLRIDAKPSQSNIKPNTITQYATDGAPQDPAPSSTTSTAPVVKYKAVEQKISIESDSENEPRVTTAPKINGGTEGTYKSDSNRPPDTVIDKGAIDLELGENQQTSHNTAAVKSKNNKQLTESTDMSVKKKCCTIL